MIVVVVRGSSLVRRLLFTLQGLTSYPSGTHQLSFRDSPVVLQRLASCPSGARQLSFRDSPFVFRDPSVVFQGLTICPSGTVSCPSGTLSLSFRNPPVVLQVPDSGPSGIPPVVLQGPVICPSTVVLQTPDSCPSGIHQSSFRDSTVILQGLTNVHPERGKRGGGNQPTTHNLYVNDTRGARDLQEREVITGTGDGTGPWGRICVFSPKPNPGVV